MMTGFSALLRFLANMSNWLGSSTSVLMATLSALPCERSDEELRSESLFDYFFGRFRIRYLLVKLKGT
jgi:hypothetical protein